MLSRTDDNNLFDLQQIDNKKNLIMKNSEEYIRFINLDNVKRIVLVNLDLIDEYLEAFRDEEF